jgi:ribosomal protein S12 methylthiotransferase accessory factor YcaO
MAKGFSERTTLPEQTLARARVAAAAKGVTRLSDITGLDRIGIPVYSAVVPKSLDTITVYNGKGFSALNAKTGALMESIERQTALYSKIEVIEGSYSELGRRRSAVLHPDQFQFRLHENYGDENPYGWVRGYDLIQDETVLVPAILGGFGPRFGGGLSPFPSYSSNGLASGNCLEEAVCHALCELVERDAWTLADLRSQWIPLARREALLGPRGDAHGADDCDVYPRIDLSEAAWPISALMEKFERAELRPVVRDISSDFGVSCVIASVADDYIPGFPQAHSGLGAHPCARIAIIRALTELAQSRAVDIQGVREDIRSADAAPAEHDRHTQRIEKIERGSWMLRPEGKQRRLAEMASTENEDIADDIRMMLAALQRQGMDRAVVVDLTEPGGFTVVRVLVPGLEFWILDQGKLGPRALQFWKRYSAAD